MSTSEIIKKESRLNKVFWTLSCVVVLGIFRFNNFAGPLIFLEVLVITIRFFIARELHAQHLALIRAAEEAFRKSTKAAEEAARKRYEDGRKASRNPDVRPAKDIVAEAAARKRQKDESSANAAPERSVVEREPVTTQSTNLFASTDTNNSSLSSEKVPNKSVSSIPCASDMRKAQSISFSPRAPGNVFGLADEMAKVGYRFVGDLYSDIQRIITNESEIAIVVKKYDLITNNEFLRGTLIRLLYAAALGTARPKESDLKPIALALRTIVESQKIVPQAKDGLSSLEMAELCSEIVVRAAARCQHGSASALVEHFNNAASQFADETISPDGPSNRRYVTALVLCFLTMVIETSKSISIVTDSLAGNRLVPIDINQLGSIDFNYLNANRPGWLAEVIANSPELQQAYLRHLRNDE